MKVTVPKQPRSVAALPEIRSSTITEGPTFDERVAQLDVMVEQLEKLGVVVPRSSRVRKYRDVIARHVQHGHRVEQLTPYQLALLAHAVAEVEEFVEIVNVLGSGSPVDGWLERMSRVVRGAEMPNGSNDPMRFPASKAAAAAAGATDWQGDFEELGGDDTLAGYVQLPVIVFDPDRRSEPTENTDAERNAQHELAVAARLRLRGCEPRFIREGAARTPDLGLKWGASDVVLEAKRLRSFEGLPAQIGDAIDQIASTGHEGIIALELTQAFDLHRKIWMLDGLDDLAPLHAALSRSLDEAGGKGIASLIQGNRRGRHVGGVLAVFRMIFFDQRTHTFGTAKPIFGGPVWPELTTAYEAAHALVGHTG